MSFLMPELILTVVIENRLQYLSEHLDHLNFMLMPYVTNRGVARLVDAKHVSQCIDYIKNNRPMVRPIYELDMNKIPSIVIASYQGESSQFIGNYGTELAAEQYDPSTVLTFDAIRNENGSIVTTSNQNVLETVWPNLYFTSGGFASKITQVVDKQSEVWLTLQDEAPVGTPLKACSIKTSLNQKWYVINSSIDMIKASVTLTTAGEHSIHRLMTVLLRYCLKSGRMLMETQGLQTPTFSQRPVQLADNEQLIWQTEFTVEAKATDHWIESESGLITAPFVANVNPTIDQESDWS